MTIVFDSGRGLARASYRAARVRTPARSRRTGARVASWVRVLLGPLCSCFKLRRARKGCPPRNGLTVPGTVEGKPVRRSRCWRVDQLSFARPQMNTGSCKQAARGTLIACNPRSICESLPLLFVSSSGFSAPQEVSRSVPHEHGRDLQRARRLSALGASVSMTILSAGFSGQNDARRALLRRISAEDL